MSQVLIKFISYAFSSALRKEQWAASSPFVVQHADVFYQKNVNENFTFKWSLRGTANLLVTILPSKTQEQWLVPFVEHFKQNAPKAYLEPSHTSKMQLLWKKLTALSIFTKKLSVWLGSIYVTFRENLRKCNF